MKFISEIAHNPIPKAWGLKFNSNLQDKLIDALHQVPFEDTVTIFMLCFICDINCLPEEEDLLGNFKSKITEQFFQTLRLSNNGGLAWKIHDMMQGFVKILLIY